MYNIDFFKKGSGIHIKPENKGKFTETKKRTGKTTEELTHSKNPLTRKRAIFAQNAKKWKHSNGGPLYAEEGAILPEIIIKPSKESNQAVEAVKEMFPDKNLRDAILKDYDNWAIDELGISQTDAVNRLYHLYKLSGSPKVSSESSLIMGQREHYNPINNTIYVPDPTFDGYIAEVSHAYQKASGRWNYLDLAKDILTHPGEWLGNASEKKKTIVPIKEMAVMNMMLMK